jgi:WD40 repeat protein
MKSVIFVKDNDLYYFKMGDKALKQLTFDKVPEVNTRFSPDGKKIAFTRNKDLFIYDLVNFQELRITSDASDRIYNGYSSWVYMEEILGRGSRYAAFWWSPDGTKIAYLRTDETQVPVSLLTALMKQMEFMVCSKWSLIQNRVTPTLKLRWVLLMQLQQELSGLKQITMLINILHGHSGRRTVKN